MARLGAFAGNYSGDLFLAFSTANQGLPPMNYGSGGPLRVPLEMLSLCYIDPLLRSRGRGDGRGDPERHAAGRDDDRP